mmetsp:Transcript_73049/g.174027  ORF Transcript_73049/g.174027 Transcript_73049/m.174027 type:complete len:225 (-) Transcript_73049:84-758(-)|eukprot:CAMPEP_0178425488 /NCGR_PEP_ID=MMETSP0689_2-20121128/28749_1 /TAXON_ID=160604 /ORGANISM="Amphidinium massartii, Strain CS-259" /LENGTH=224 /DNA_ID=CAMNT_0020047153 /DNA_START=34 /DNA_END=708 /DNA_ORIENTATION=-
MRLVGSAEARRTEMWLPRLTILHAVWAAALELQVSRAEHATLVMNREVTAVVGAGGEITSIEGVDKAPAVLRRSAQVDIAPHHAEPAGAALTSDETVQVATAQHAHVMPPSHQEDQVVESSGSTHSSSNGSHSANNSAHTHGHNASNSHDTQSHEHEPTSPSASGHESTSSAPSQKDNLMTELTWMFVAGLGIMVVIVFLVVVYSRLTAMRGSFHVEEASLTPR